MVDDKSTEFNQIAEVLEQLVRDSKPADGGEMGESMKSKGEAKPLRMGNIVTAKELSQFLKLSKSKIYELAFGGELPGFKIGDSWRFDMEEIIQWVRGRSRSVQGG